MAESYYGDHEDSGYSLQDPNKSTLSEAADSPPPPKTFSKVSEGMLILAKQEVSTSDALPILQIIEQSQASDPAGHMYDLSLDDTAGGLDPVQGPQQPMLFTIEAPDVMHPEQESSCLGTSKLMWLSHHNSFIQEFKSIIPEKEMRLKAQKEAVERKLLEAKIRLLKMEEECLTKKMEKLPEMRAYAREEVAKAREKLEISIAKLEKSQKEEKTIIEEECAMMKEHLDWSMKFSSFCSHYTSDSDDPIEPFSSCRCIGATTVGVVVYNVTNSPRLFKWKGYGLRLIIPLGSLPSRIKSCTITINATLSGQYQFPPNTHLVSPVFWLRCEPYCKFNKPLTLEIQHCAPLKNSSALFIVKAKCTQKDLPYSFKTLHGGTFTETSSYGSIALDSFSGIEVIQERSDERRYWSNVFYMGPPNNRDIHFTITWHDDAHITVSMSGRKIAAWRVGDMQGPYQLYLNAC